MKFSVIVPVYNVADYLKRCTDSIMAQSFYDYELILVDDGSTDQRSGAICDACAADDPERIRVLHQANGGLGAARNAGIEMARGEYLIFVDSDDYVAPDLLEKLSEQLYSCPADIVHYGFYLSNGQTLEEHIPKLPAGSFDLEHAPSLLLEEPTACARAWKRELFVSSGIRFPARVWYEDIRTTPKLYALAKQMTSISEPLYYYVERENSITRNTNAERNSEIIDAMTDLLSWYKKNRLFKSYQNFLCRMTVDHLLIAASVRILMIDPQNPLLGKLYEKLLELFPDYRENPLLSELPRQRKLVLLLLEKRQYRLIKLLFQIKEKIGR